MAGRLCCSPGRWRPPGARKDRRPQSEGASGRFAPRPGRTARPGAPHCPLTDARPRPATPDPVRTGTCAGGPDPSRTMPDPVPAKPDPVPARRVPRPQAAPSTPLRTGVPTRGRPPIPRRWRSYVHGAGRRARCRWRSFVHVPTALSDPRSPFIQWQLIYRILTFDYQDISHRGSGDFPSRIPAMFLLRGIVRGNTLGPQTPVDPTTKSAQREEA